MAWIILFHIFNCDRCPRKIKSTRKACSHCTNRAKPKLVTQTKLQCEKSSASLRDFLKTNSYHSEKPRFLSSRSRWQWEWCIPKTSYYITKGHEVIALSRVPKWKWAATAVFIHTLPPPPQSGFRLADSSQLWIIQCKSWPGSHT